MQSWVEKHFDHEELLAHKHEKKLRARKMTSHMVHFFNDIVHSSSGVKLTVWLFEIMPYGAF
jgi:hypothetical protein